MRYYITCHRLSLTPILLNTSNDIEVMSTSLSIKMATKEVLVKVTMMMVII